MAACFARLGIISILGSLLLTSCLPSGAVPLSKVSSSTQPITAASVTPAPTGPRAVRILFKQATTGSFDAPLATGTPIGLGNGLPAMRVYNPDGSLLSDKAGPTASAWPAWLKSLEIGISGSSNTAATNPDCMRFSGTNESTSQCSFSNQPVAGVVQATNCGAPAGQLRVSEHDCQAGTIADGNGGPNDGVYIRANFCRLDTCLGSQENILAVLEYAASGLSAPADPSACMVGGVFTPEACSDTTWKVFLKSDPSLVNSPFMMLVPPTMASVNTAYPPNVGTGGAGFTTKQFVLPLAADATLKTMQISRIKSVIPNTGMFNTVCAPNGAPANSAYCVGMVFMSLTLYRM